jgi:predicted outer membrane repeat protein
MTATRTRRRLARTASLLAAGMLGLLPAGAAADTFDVNRRGDPAPGSCTPGHCTLREAVFAAEAADGDDTIRLPSRKPYKLKRDASLPGPEAAKGDLDFVNAFGLDNDLKITHPGRGRATINAAPSGDRAIELDGVVTLAKTTVRGGVASSTGEAGGAISATDGVVILRRARLVGNSAPDVGGGISVTDASVIATNTVIKNNSGGNGGGIFVGGFGRMELTRSTVEGNESSSGGGGIYHEDGVGTSRIDESTVARNEAGGDGGALDTAAEEFRITNSTFSKNSATGRGGAIYAAPDTNMLVNHATIARNRSDSDDTGLVDSGGGIYADGGSDVIEMRNSILAKNRATAGAFNDCDAPAPVGVASVGGNLLSTTAGGCDFFGDPEDILAPDPRIAKLKDAGGPTETIPLKSGSAAINEADGPAPLPRDQRGVVRQNPDIGAFER